MIARVPGKKLLLAATAVCGAAAAGSYWAREIRAVREEHEELARLRRQRLAHRKLARGRAPARETRDARDREERRATKLIAGSSRAEVVRPEERLDRRPLEARKG